MSLNVSCSCGKSYKVKEGLAGRKIKCPSCQSILQVPGVDDPLGAKALGIDTLAESSSPTPSPLQSPLHQSPYSKGTQASSASKSTNPESTSSFFAATGYTAVNRGVMFVLVGSAIGFLHVLLGTAKAYIGFGGMGLVSSLNSMAMILASLICIVGYFFCTKVPKETNTQVFPWISLCASGCLTCVSFLLVILGIVYMFSERMSDFSLGMLRAISMMSWVASFCSLLVIVSFLVFLVKLANFTGQKKISDKVLMVLYTYFGLIAFFVMTSVLFALVMSVAARGASSPGEMYERAKSASVIALLLGIVTMFLNLGWQGFYCYVLHLCKFRAPVSRKVGPSVPGWKTKR